MTKAAEKEEETVTDKGRGILDLDEATGKPLTDDEIIGRRSADILDDVAKGNEHVKVFVIGTELSPAKIEGFDHEPQKAATRQYAISQGMRPVGDVRIVSTKRNKTGFGWDVTYAVEVAVDERLGKASGPDIVSNGPSDPAKVDVNPEHADDKTTA